MFAIIYLQIKKLLLIIIDKQDSEPILRPNMPELDFLRGVAVLMVIFLHGFFWTVTNFSNLSYFTGLQKFLISFTQVGWLGVQLFFILSGFLITGILLDNKNRSNYFSKFYTRRALRILPAYIALLVLLKIFGVAQWPFLIISLLFLPNFSAFFGIPMQYGPLWSLGVEEQFYLLWPQFVYRLSKKCLTIVALIIVILIPFLRLTSFYLFKGIDLYYYTWFVADALALGALLAILLRTKYANRKNLFLVSFFAIITSLFLLVIGTPFGILHRNTPVGAMLQLVPWHLLFLGVMIMTLLLGTCKFKNLVLINWLRFFGYISYGLYLIHFLIFNLFDKIINSYLPQYSLVIYTTFFGLSVRFIIVFTTSVVISLLSRKYFEEYFLKLKNKL